MKEGKTTTESKKPRRKKTEQKARAGNKYKVKR